MKLDDWKYIQPPVGEDVIDSVEKNLGVTLPEDYRAVISEYSGARPKANAINLLNEREVIFEQLLSIDDKQKNNVSNVVKIVNKFSNQKLIPFGNDPFGNLFCFKYAKNQKIEVIFWSHETNETSKICETFTEFISKLHLPNE